MDRTDYSNVKLIVLSVGGVFTDGTSVYGHSGVMYKSFCGKDFVALEKLAETFDIVIMSSDYSGIHYNIFNKKGFVFYKAKNKKKKLKQILKTKILTLDECLYVGDDLCDLPCIRMVPLSFCPKDAFDEVIEVASVLPVCGGQGVVYKLYRLLLPEIILRYKYYK